MSAASAVPSDTGLAYVPLADLVEFRRGLTYRKADEVAYSSNAVLRANNVDLSSGCLDLADIRFISDKVEVPESKRLVPESLLICTASGSRSHLGKVAYIESETGYAFGGFMGLLVPTKRVSAKYLYYFFRSDAYQDFLASLSAGANINNLRFSDLGKLLVPVPTEMEQKQIVAILDQAFAALDRARAHAEVNLVDARVLRSKMIAGELSDESLGPLETLGPHVEFLTGFAFKSAGYSDHPDDVRLVRGDNIVQGAFRWTGVKRWPSTERVTYSKYELKLNDVLVAMDRTWVSAGIKYAIVDKEALPSLLVQRVARLRARSSILPAYLGYWIGSSLFETYVLSIQTGLGVPHVSGSQIERFKLRIPSLKVQKALLEKFDRLSDECEKLNTAYTDQLTGVAALRHSLLEQAFSGQL